MPNHWHLVLWPLQDGDLGCFMQKLTTTHGRRWHLHHHSVGTGHLHQGTYKTVPTEEDDHLDTVLRDVERNAVRPTMVERTEDWTWNSLLRWLHPTEHQEKPIFRPWPIRRPHDWVTRVNRDLTKKIGKLCKLLSSEAAPSAQSHSKRQPPNNSASNPHFAPEADRKWRSTTAIPKLLDLSPFHFSRRYPTARIISRRSCCVSWFFHSAAVIRNFRITDSGENFPTAKTFKICSLIVRTSF